MHFRSVDEATWWCCRPKPAQILSHVLNLESSLSFLSRVKFELEENSVVGETANLTRCYLANCVFLDAK